MTAASLVYRTSWGYELAMLMLYGRHYAARYQCVADLIEHGASVLDVCCGPAVLYHRYLISKNISYIGVDINLTYISSLRRKGLRGEVLDLRQGDPLPQADIVVMQASLYQFLPDVGPVIERLFRSSRKRVIIAEPIRNLADSRCALLAALAQGGADAGLGACRSRFNESTLERTMRSLSRAPSQSFLIPGGREKVYVFEVDL